MINLRFFVPPRTVIGQRLAAMNLLSPLAMSDEFSTVRLQHNRAFTELLSAASSSLYPQVAAHLTTVLITQGAYCNKDMKWGVLFHMN